ncbi:MAG: bestrophin family ion channel [Bacteroidota bacterium]
MYVRRNIRWSIILRFAWFNLVKFTLWAAFVVWVFHFYEHQGVNISIPFLPLSTIGIAVAFYLSFKNNASYDRFWEARKIWGGIVNYSRTWANQVMSFVSNHEASEKLSEKELQEIRRQLIHRHVAWLNALRLHLRQPVSFSLKHKRSVRGLAQGSPEREHWDEEVGELLDAEEYNYLIDRRNTPTQIIRKQGEMLRIYMEEKGLINNFRHMEMMRVLEEFYNLQGKCERIKNTPFPRQYAYFSKLFTSIFILLLPIGLVGEFYEMGHGFIVLTIPFSVLISWVFSTMEMVGDNSEDPFENFVNDVPMTALCRTIEIDLREMLGEKELPPSIKAVNDILM